MRLRSAALDPAVLVGTLTAADGETLTIQPTRGEPTVVARRDLTRMEMSVRPGRKGKAAVLGLAVGFAAGYAAAAALGNCSESPGVVDNCGDPTWSSLYGAVAGVVGSCIGALLAPGEKWAEVPVVRSANAADASRERVQLRLRPIVGQRRGVRLVVSWR